MSQARSQSAPVATPVSAVPLTGVALVLVSAAAFSLQGLFAQLAYRAGASTPTEGFVRFGVTALVLWGYIFARRLTASFPVRLPGRTVVALLVLGAAGYFLGSLSYLGAVATIPVSLAGLLLYTYPAFATVLAIRMGREQFTRPLAGGLITVLAGVGVTLGIPALAATRHPDLRGVLLVLGSALLYAGYIVGSERTVQAVHAVLAMAYIATGATLSYLVLVALTGTFTPGMGAAGWGWLAAMALVSTVVAAGTFLAALRRLGPARAATLSTLEPLLTVIFAALFLGEHLQAAQLGGGLLILAGVLVIVRERRPHPEPPRTQ